MNSIKQNWILSLLSELCKCFWLSSEPKTLWTNFIEKYKIRTESKII